MITVHHSLPSVAVIAALDTVIATRGQPVGLLLDNGSEFRSRAFDAWAADRGITLAFSQPGKPIQNAQIESFNGRLRDECFTQRYFLSLNDARFHVERWRRAYNEERPHEAGFPVTPHGIGVSITVGRVDGASVAPRERRQPGGDVPAPLDRHSIARLAGRENGASSGAMPTQTTLSRRRDGRPRQRSLRGGGATGPCSGSDRGGGGARHA